MYQDRSEASSLPVRRPSPAGPDQAPARPPRRTTYPDGSPQAAIQAAPATSRPRLLVTLGNAEWRAQYLPQEPDSDERWFLLIPWGVKSMGRPLVLLGSPEDPEQAIGSAYDLDGHADPALYGQHAQRPDGKPLDPTVARDLIRDAVAIGLLEKVPLWDAAEWDSETIRFRPCIAGNDAESPSRAPGFLPGLHLERTHASPYGAERLERKGGRR